MNLPLAISRADLWELGCIFIEFKDNFACAILLDIVAVCHWESSLYLLYKDYDFEGRIKVLVAVAVFLVVTTVNC